MTGKRNAAIDLAKYIASILIVALHAGLFQDISSKLYFVTVQYICRFAVPFFLVCTGYFLTGKWNFNGGGRT